MMNDSFIISGILLLYIGAGLLQSSLSDLYSYYQHQQQDQISQGANRPQQLSATSLAVLEMLWSAIFSVKFAYLANFKFHKPPYKYVSGHLTRYYWFVGSFCGIGFVFTLIAQAVVVLCANSDGGKFLSISSTNLSFNVLLGHLLLIHIGRMLGKCHFSGTKTSRIFLEMLLSGLDIVADVFVVSIPLMVIKMAHMGRRETVNHAAFKCLSVFMIAVAITRLSLQYDQRNHRIDYIWTSFWLYVEAAVALIVASIMPWRKIFFEPQYRHVLRGRKENRMPNNHFQLMDVNDCALGEGMSGGLANSPSKRHSIPKQAFLRGSTISTPTHAPT